MLNAARVLMILAGIFGLPSFMCSAACSGMGEMTGANVDAPEGQAIMDFLMYLSLIASLGSIIVGALARRLRKAVSGILALVFCLAYAALLLQMNVFGLVSSLMLLIAAIMIFVAPAEQFQNVQKVKVVD